MKRLKIRESITSKDGGLDCYLREVSMYPLLTVDEEAQLAHIIQNEKDPKLAKDAVDRLVKSNLRFVISVAKQYQNTQSSALKLLDLINEGNIGLFRAAKKFDATRGFKFISYAVWWIRQSILESIGKNGRLIRMPSNKLSTPTRIRNYQDRYFAQYGYYPSLCEIKNELTKYSENLTSEGIQIILLHSKSSLSLDASSSSDDKGSEGNLYSVLRVDTVEPNKRFDNDDRRRLINSLLERLDDKNRKILTMYYGLDGRPPSGFSAIAMEFDCTTQTIRTRIDNSTKILRRIAMKQNLSHLVDRD